MSPDKRIRPKRRRRMWAAPFVVTAALSAPACVAQESPKGTNMPPNPPGPHERHQPTEQAQPQPDRQAPPAQTGSGEEPRVVTNPPAPTTLPAAPTSGGTVHTRKDGTCWWHAKVEDCPEGAICNPPPPRQVQCPPDDAR